MPRPLMVSGYRQIDNRELIIKYNNRHIYDCNCSLKCCACSFFFTVMVIIIAAAVLVVYWVIKKTKT
jgi:hypothetical protein